MTLDEFRKDVPEYRRHERYVFFHHVADIVQGYYLASQSHHDLYPLDVEKQAKAYDMKKYVPKKERDLKMRNGGMSFSILNPIQLGETDAAMEMPVERLKDPLLFGMVDGKPWLLDGHHRLYRAYQEEIEELFAYILTEEETLEIGFDVDIGE